MSVQGERMIIGYLLMIPLALITAASTYGLLDNAAEAISSSEFPTLPQTYVTLGVLGLIFSAWSTKHISSLQRGNYMDL